MSAGAIIAIIDVVFFVLLGLGFLEGFLRGVKRSSLELGISIAGIIIVALITPVDRCNFKHTNHSKRDNLIAENIYYKHAF